MKFYKAKNSTIGQGVKAIVLYHKVKGDELICVYSDFGSFEKQNPKAKECTKEEADKLLKKAKPKITLPSKEEIRERDPLDDQAILKEIESKKTKTVDIKKNEVTNEQGENIQKLTYFEEKEIRSVDDFLAVQEKKNLELEKNIKI